MQTRERFISPCSNPSICTKLPTDFQTFYLTTNGCSCDFFYQENVEDVEKEKLRLISLRKKYQKKKWAENKIERAISQSIANQHPPNPPGLTDKVKNLLKDLVSKSIPTYLVINWYNDQFVDKEIVQINEQINITTDELLTHNLIQKTKTLYFIK